MSERRVEADVAGKMTTKGKEPQQNLVSMSSTTGIFRQRDKKGVGNSIQDRLYAERSSAERDLINVSRVGVPTEEKIKEKDQNKIK